FVIVFFFYVIFPWLLVGFGGWVCRGGFFLLVCGFVGLVFVVGCVWGFWVGFGVVCVRLGCVGGDVCCCCGGGVWGVLLLAFGGVLWWLVFGLGVVGCLMLLCWVCCLMGLGFWSCCLWGCVCGCCWGVVCGFRA
ncbi:hypothetical protein, partial [Pseudomonas syringae group genomosp. 7]|uniref:hypothetical protein n=1 Tax=Pseudomonas syringae group genomosp. 7 TaxID=251699 RepID=UPI00376F52DD